MLNRLMFVKEDITQYIAKNTGIPYLFDAAQKKCAIDLKLLNLRHTFRAISVHPRPTWSCLLPTVGVTWLAN